MSNIKLATYRKYYAIGQRAARAKLANEGNLYSGNDFMSEMPEMPEPQRAPGRAEAPPPRVNTPEFQQALYGHALRDQNEMARALDINNPYSSNDFTSEMPEMPVMPEKQRAPGRAEAPPPRVNTPEFQQALYGHALRDQNERLREYLPPEKQRAPGRAEAPPPRVNTPEFQQALYGHALRDQNQRISDRYSSNVDSPPASFNVPK
jgi:hypothetical protein